MRHHSLTYHLNSLMQSKAFQDYQVQGEFRCRNYFKGTDAYCLVIKSCLTLCNPMDCSLPGSPVPGIFQARMLECVAIPFSSGSSDPGTELSSPALQADCHLSHQESP